MKSPDAMTREELSAEVTRLRGELGLMREERIYTALRKALRMTPVETRLLMALHNAGGAPMTAWDLEPMAPSQSRKPRGSNVMAVYVCRIRKAIGNAAIERVWNKGWALTPVGIAAVDKALSDAGVAL